jgi:uncharacterized membrane protein YgdD (TMEM256/DUF423 family)
MPPRYTLTVASLLMAAAVALGALGAHALAARLAPDALAIWRTAVTYHAWHALALLAIGVLQRLTPAPRGVALAATLLVAGIVLFSGSLYLLALGAPRGWGYLTPAGGVALIAGWLVLAATVTGRARRA